MVRKSFSIDYISEIQEDQQVSNKKSEILFST